MARSDKSLNYAPSPPPLIRDEAAFRQWCVREFQRIADTLKEGAFQGLRLDILQQLPLQPKAGMVKSFDADVVGPGKKIGLYEHDGTQWNKL